MIERTLFKELFKWKERKTRKPIIIRGARQVGKTTAIDLFSKNFKQYIYLNLEQDEDRKFFESGISFEDLVAAIFLSRNKTRNIETLLFIDEIQNSPNAVKELRYFYEKNPEIFVIAASSLLETLIDKNTSFPVGRVEYLILRPFSFIEFLQLLEEKSALDAIATFPVQNFAHDKLLSLFHKYILIGGMPEAVSVYSRNRDFTETNRVYESLIVSYIDDVEKYSRSFMQTNVIRHIINHVFIEAGNRIKFEGFGRGPYKSREVGEGIRILEKAMLLDLVYPFTGCSLPIIPDRKKSPRLHFLDTGLINYFSGIQNTLLLSKDISSLYKGRIIEHIVGQEILASTHSPLTKLYFWVKEKKQSNAEIDYLIQFKNILIPVEVKSGATGRLRSLHQFMDNSSESFAIRLYSGRIKIEQARTIAGKKFQLLNLPYYLAGNLHSYIESAVIVES